VAPTIAIIGAGSAVFSLGLIRDLCLTERLHGSTMRLMDIDEARLQAISRLCERYSDETGAGIQTQRLPDAVLAQLWRDRVGPVTIKLAAYDEGSRERLLELELTNPWTRSWPCPNTWTCGHTIDS
jgi:hypothetical protein